jgi:hypothetical protein
LLFIAHVGALPFREQTMGQRVGLNLGKGNRGKPYES